MNAAIENWHTDPARYTQEIEALIAGGFDVNRKLGLVGERALHFVVDTGGSTALFSLFVKAGAAIDAPDHFGVTPLMMAVSQPDAGALVARMLAAGANIRSLDASNMTALHHAARAKMFCAGHADALIAAGANLLAPMKGGWTPFHIANTVEAIDYFVARGIPLDYVPDEAGPIFPEYVSYLTPLQYMINQGKVGLVEYCARVHGLDLDQKTLSGRSLMQVASTKPEMKALLRAMKTGRAIESSVGVDAEPVAVKPKKSALAL